MRTPPLTEARWRSLLSIGSQHKSRILCSRIRCPAPCQKQFSTTPVQSNPLDPKIPLALEAKAQKPKRKPNNKLRIASTLAITAVLASAFLFLADPNSKGVKKIFDPPRFTSFTIIKREEVSPTSIILTLRPQTLANRPRKLLADPYEECWEKGTWSVEIKQPELQIARSYTPLPPNKGDPKGDLRFLIRKEHKGEVSGYLHSLGVGAEVHLRGPHEEFELPIDVKKVLFLAGGTGIAPALQVAYTLLQTTHLRAEKPRIHIVWASRKRADCEGGADGRNPNAWEGHKPGCIVQELENLQQKFPGQLSVDYLVDEEGSFLDQKRISSLTKAVTGVKAGAPNGQFVVRKEETHARRDGQMHLVLSEQQNKKRLLMEGQEQADKFSQVEDVRFGTWTGSNLLFVSGPEGFINYIAGPKIWEGGKEGQGQLGGLLGQMRLKTWKVWKL